MTPSSFTALMDLVLPVACGGCDLPGIRWCASCAAALAGPPRRIGPRADPGVPCWAVAPYSGPARHAVLAAKERGRRDLAEPLGAALAGALAVLRTPGRPLILVPAPSRRAAARRRGGDPVLAAARVAQRWLPDSRVVSALRVGPGVRDSVGLGRRERERNLVGRITVAPPGRREPFPGGNAEVVVVDDVLTTGVTAREAVRALRRHGGSPEAVVVTCAA